MVPVDVTPPAMLSVEVAYAPRPGVVDCVSLSVPEGTTVAQAVQRSGLLQRHGWTEPHPPPCGVWSKLRPADHLLRTGDRVEIYRPLKVDPKEARRQRYRRQPAGPAGPKAPQGGFL